MASYPVKIKLLIKLLLASVVLAASASSAFATLLLANTYSGFKNLDMGSFGVATPSNISASLGYSPTVDFGLGFGETALGKVTFYSWDLSGIGLTFSGYGDVFSIDNLGVGTYSLHVHGSVEGGGLALLAANITTTPIPEPATLALVLGSLGIMGVIVRRRKTAKV